MSKGYFRVVNDACSHRIVGYSMDHPDACRPRDHRAAEGGRIPVAAVVPSDRSSQFRPARFHAVT